MANHGNHGDDIKDVHRQDLKDGVEGAPSPGEPGITVEPATRCTHDHDALRKEIDYLKEVISGIGGGIKDAADTTGTEEHAHLADVVGEDERPNKAPWYTRG